MKKIRFTIITTLFIGLLGFQSCNQAQNNGNSPAQNSAESPGLNLDEFSMEEISDEDLTGWEFRGLGEAYQAGSGQFCMTEADSTVGVMMISPKSYDGDVVVRYETMTLTNATVLVAMLAASDQGSGSSLSISDGYNGNMGLWINEKDNYFIAFRNEPHNFTPFIRKYPVPGGDALVSAADNFMLPGKYYAIEIGKVGQKIWLSVDGEKIIEATDQDILPGGHITFRIRGVANFKAACLIKDLKIYSR